MPPMPSSPPFLIPAPHPRARPSPAGAVPGEHSPWGQLLGLLFQGQGEAPGQRTLGAGAGSGRHAHAIVQQLQRGRFSDTQTTASSLPTCRLPPQGVRTQHPIPTCPPGQPQPGWQGSCTQMAPGCRCQQRRGHEVAQALSTWPGGHSVGCTQIGRWEGPSNSSPREGAALSPTSSPHTYPPWLGQGLGSAAMEGSVTCRPGHSPGQGCRLHSCRCSVSWAWHGAIPGPPSQLRCRSIVPPPQGAEQLLQADQGPRTGHPWCGHTRDPLTQVLWTGVSTKGSSQGEQNPCSPAMPTKADLPRASTQSSLSPGGAAAIPVLAVQLHHLGRGQLPRGIGTREATAARGDRHTVPILHQLARGTAAA